eukprot:CAMPEP_0177670722 /NCGR_PEP_ID=MMETSP0447-20121125/24254_1 /TAXON_ID=0 /ORGANISM="Stygamoeba regulata, Strain BSH-02190019" /LENGTH=87 /DNA_ID=CAMNT_0019177931 /DNA_START=142 /DNA_END=402 /DNA_ORIENTATION=-
MSKNPPPPRDERYWDPLNSPSLALKEAVWTPNAPGNPSHLGNSMPTSPSPAPANPVASLASPANPAAISPATSNVIGSGRASGGPFT